MNNLIIIPFHDLKGALKEGFRTRDTHLYEHFMNNDMVDNLIIINRPTSLAEVLLRKKKIKTIKNILYKKNFTYIQKYRNNVYVIDFFVIDFFNVILKKHAWIPSIYSEKNISLKITNALNYLKIHDFSIYMSSPFSVELGLNLNAKVNILDAVDNFSKYKNWTYFKPEIESLYNKAKVNFDYIFVNSQDTFDYLSNKCHAKLQLIPNGVDFEKFQGHFERPKDLPSDRPIVGYAGKIQRMFDVELLAKLAKNNSEINFVILGKFLDLKWKNQYWDKNISGIKNIHILGDKSYNSLPNYYNHFDICFIPYSITNQHGGDPIKFYEYLACNKPIISTNIGNIKKFNNGKSIFICDTSEEFIQKFELLIKNYKKLIINHSIPSNLTWLSISKYMLSKLFKL